MIKKIISKLFNINPTQYNEAKPVVDVDSSQTTTGLPLNTSDLEQCIINHEGLKHYVYIDTTNHYTIGIGRNVSSDGPGLTTEECVYLLRNDLNRIIKSISSCSWYKFQDSVRQGVLIELAFNMGVDGLLSFKLMLLAMMDKDYIKAAEQLLDSKWAQQVKKDRATDLANRLRTGTY